MKSWLRQTSLPHVQVMRARIVLAPDSGQTPTQISQFLSVARLSVYRCKARYVQDGVDGLIERERSGRPTVINEETVRRVLKLTTQRVPQEAAHWSQRLMAKYAGVSTWQVRQIWEAADLKPHRIKTFKISNDPQFADKVVDIVGLYMNPPSNALVLCVDEKTPIQALDRTQPGLPLSRGRIASRTHDYKRHGTTCLYAAFNVLPGKVIGKTSESSRSAEFLKFIKLVKRRTPKDKDLLSCWTI